MEMLEGIISGNQKFAFLEGATPPSILDLGWAAADVRGAFGPLLVEAVVRRYPSEYNSSRGIWD